MNADPMSSNLKTQKTQQPAATEIAQMKKNGIK